MKRFLTGCLLAACCCASLSVPAAENVLARPAQAANRNPGGDTFDDSSYPVVDRIVAVVDTQVITESELDDRLALITRELNDRHIALPDPEILIRQVLEKMVMDSVQLQFAKTAGIKVDDAMLDQSLARLAAENRMSLTAFRAAVEKDGAPWNQFREDIRQEIILTRLREREVENRVNVTDAEIDAQLQEEKERGAAALDEYNLAHILITVPDNASPERLAQRQRKAERALEQLKKGADFSEVAASFSEAPDALKGGGLGWREAARLPTLFANEAARLKPGEFSGIMRSPNGFHIIKLIDRRSAAAPAPVTQYHVRQILVRANPNADSGDASNKIMSLNSRLLGGADFAKLATISSEDESRNRGGDLGWISEGETLPQFEKVVKSLKPGEISAPFQTPLGWHIVQLIAVRQADANLERRRLAARQALRARKSDEIYDEWVRQLRDQAYVDVRLEDH
ncbi:MAG: peptidylprolyl isomerase [Betaproteobacteria bacterium]|nr:peptidylprolyl isomerase [Betaproteobacteria bacterium]